MTVPLVSIVMPAWRPHREWLLAAVQGVLAERGCKLELIVVDDGSPEPVADALHGIDDPRVRVIRIEHAGQSATRNAGIEAAEGTHLRFIDCDDVVAPASTSTLLALAGGGADVITYGSTQFCDENLVPKSLLVCDHQGPAALDCVLGQLPVMGQAMLFPKAVVDAAGPWDVTIDVMADWEWVLRTLDHAPIRGDRRPAYFYRQHASSIQGRTSDEAAEAVHHRIIDGYLARNPDHRRGPLGRKIRASADLKYAATYLRERQAARSLHRLARGARVEPLGGAKVALELARAQARQARSSLLARRNRPHRARRAVRPPARLATRRVQKGPVRKGQ